jgi:hypothetical protein
MATIEEVNKFLDTPIGDINKPEFKKWSKMPRFRNQYYVITEKIDGSNGVIHITQDNQIFAGSRQQWITVEKDNFGFAKFVEDNKEELLKLGPGYHYGEWYGQGIQRKYGLTERKFALFNIFKWNKDNKPSCCETVPIINKRSIINTSFYDLQLICQELKIHGSRINNFSKPEGICIYNTEAGKYFKMMCDNDDIHKGEI